MGRKVDGWLVVAAVLLSVALISSADVVWRALAGVLGGYLVLAVIFGWPLPGREPGVAIGGGTPLMPPRAYQVAALRQVLMKVAETTDETYYGLLDAVLKSLPRRGVDLVYEPLHLMSCDEGLAELVRLGEIEALPGGDGYHYRIKRPARRRFPRFSRRGR